jgi:2-polyprenyl-3-methyl-5-hydroxy-6-metoxy-1,4-benzoquinol methylase
MISVTTCPSCGHNSWRKHLRCIDHTVSHETFEITTCTKCALLATSPRPDDEKIGTYYQSSDYISHTSKAASTIDRIYLIAREFTLGWKENLVRKHTKAAQQILDYGCGTGDFLSYCAQRNWKISGVEPAVSARAIASSKTNVPIHSDIKELSNERYSAITLWHVLEHVPDLNLILTELRSHLAKDGTLFIAVPNHESFDAKYYQSYWAGYDVPRHLWHFNPESMKILLDKNGLQVTQTYPMKLDSFYVSLLSEKYINNGKATLFSLIKAFFLGVTSNLKAITTGKYSSLIYVCKKNGE